MGDWCRCCSRGEGKSGLFGPFTFIFECFNIRSMDKRLPSLTSSLIVLIVSGSFVPAMMGRKEILPLITSLKRYNKLLITSMELMSNWRHVS